MFPLRLQSHTASYPSTKLLVLNALLMITLQLGVLSTFARSTHSKESSSTTSQNVDTPLGLAQIGISYPAETSQDAAPFTFAIKIQKPTKLNLIPNDLNGQYGDFDFVFIAEKREQKNADSEIVTRVWNLYPAHEGTLRIPPIPLAFELSDKETLDVTIPAKELYVAPPQAKFSDDEVSFYLDPILTQNRVWIIVAVIVALIATSLIQKSVLSFLRRKRNVETIPNLSQEPPFDRAIRLLMQLTSTISVETGARRFCADVDLIFRNYISSIYNLETQGKTTEEIVRSLQVLFEATPETSDNLSLKRSTQTEVLLEITTTLKELDLYKFARTPLPPEKMTAISRQVENVVKHIHKSGRCQIPVLSD